MNKINKLLSKEIIRKLPKGELHFHLDGGLRVKTIMELADQQKVKLPASTYEEVKKLVNVPLDCQSLVQFLEAFGITLSVMQTKESIERIIYEACEDASNDGVRYLEIRFSPVLHLEKGLTIKEVLQAACDMIPVVEEKIPITLRYIVCGMRHLPSDVSTQLARETINFLNKGVVAFDLAGPELGFPASIHKEAYDIILEAGLLSTCHAGESDGPSSIKTAMEVGKIKRIGHGVALINDSNLLEEVKQKDMALEVCVTSNILTKFSKTYEEHPIDALYRKGLAIVPCTDNTLMCDVTLTDEYHIIHTQKGFSISDMLICMDNSFKHGFLTDKKLQNQIRLDACKTYHDVLSVEGFLDNEVSETIEKIKKQISLDV